MLNEKDLKDYQLAAIDFVKEKEFTKSVYSFSKL